MFVEVQEMAIGDKEARRIIRLFQEGRKLIPEGEEAPRKADPPDCGCVVCAMERTLKFDDESPVQISYTLGTAAAREGPFSFRATARDWRIMLARSLDLWLDPKVIAAMASGGDVPQPDSHQDREVTRICLHLEEGASKHWLPRKVRVQGEEELATFWFCPRCYVRAQGPQEDDLSTVCVEHVRELQAGGRVHPLTDFSFLQPGGQQFDEDQARAIIAAVIEYFGDHPERGIRDTQDGVVREGRLAVFQPVSRHAATALPRVAVQTLGKDPPGEVAYHLCPASDVEEIFATAGDSRTARQNAARAGGLSYHRSR